MYNPQAVKVELPTAENLAAAFERRLQSYLDALGHRHELTEDESARKAIEAQAAAIGKEYEAQKSALDAIRALPPQTPLFFIELGSERKKEVPDGAFNGRENFHDMPMESLGTRYIVAPLNDTNMQILADAKALGEEMVRSWTRKTQGHGAVEKEKEGAAAGTASGMQP